ncbi:Spy/CpxP family protein refolding chaperone [Fortiea contorta]|uniref:Spy/CpxP family protein refolding chaperone n=1 Tax=Fortiea contorta TaxID=1892405 RepID=UPI00034545FF|nr:hypothetical protein [Fortiea contorta]
MKLKVLSIAAGALALTLTATPFIAQAQPASPANQPGVEAPKKERGPWKNLNLTEDQKNQLKTIRTNTRSRIEALLTPEQKQKLQEAKANRSRGQRPQGERSQGGPFAFLNLSETQKTQIKQIMESSKQEMEAVLTPEQRQKLQEFKNNARARRQPATR